MPELGSFPRIAPALDKGLTILEYLAKNSSHLYSLTQIGRALHMPKSSLFRLMATLECRGYVERDGAGLYRLGTKVLEFQTTYLPWPRLRGVASPIMHELAQRARETCHLAVLGEGGAIYLEKVEGPKPYTIATKIGGKTALHASAVGKVLLAGLNQQELEETVARYGLPRLTHKTITSFDKLKRHLAQVKEQGYAVDDEEEELGMRCVAAPLRDHQGEVIAALSLTGLSPSFGPGRIDYLIGLVKEAAGRISAQLGYQAAELASSKPSETRSETPFIWQG